MDRLAVIITDMIRSALAWEQEHGLPRYDNSQNEPPKPLTILGVTDRLNASENAVKGENYDHQE